MEARMLQLKLLKRTKDTLAAERDYLNTLLEMNQLQEKRCELETEYYSDTNANALTELRWNEVIDRIDTLATKAETLQVAMSQAIELQEEVERQIEALEQVER